MVTKDKDRRFSLRKGTIHPEDTVFIKRCTNIYKWCFQQGAHTLNTYRTHVTGQRQQNNLLKKRAEDLNGHLSDGDTQTANSHRRGRATSPVIREPHIETTVGHASHQPGWPSPETQQTTGAGEDGKRGALCAVTGNGHWDGRRRTSVGVPQETESRVTV